MSRRGMRVLSMLYVLPIVLGLAALLACTGESGGGCGPSSTTTCGAGTKKVKTSDGGYECRPNG